MLSVYKKGQWDNPLQIHSQVSKTYLYNNTQLSGYVLSFWLENKFVKSILEVVFEYLILYLLKQPFRHNLFMFRFKIISPEGTYYKRQLDVSYWWISTSLWTPKQIFFVYLVLTSPWSVFKNYVICLTYIIYFKAD